MNLPTEQLTNADHAYHAQVTAQTERITAELNKLEQLLQAGLVDRSVLVPFREAVCRIRHTSWSVQQWMEGGDAALPAMLRKERMRIVEQMATQLSSDLAAPTTEVDGQELASLEKAVERLSLALLRRKGN